MSHSFEIAISEEFTIRGNVHVDETCGHKQPILIFCHGFKGFKDWGSFPHVAEAFAKQGIATIRFNFSCNGVGSSLTEFDELDKFAINTYKREINDLRILVDALYQGNMPRTEYVDLNKLFIIGHSKGGGDAILFGANNPRVRGVVTWNGISHVDLFTEEKLRQEIITSGIGYMMNTRTGQRMPISKVVVDDIEENVQAYDLLKKVAEMSQPLLLVQGDNDYHRLVKGAEKLKEAAPHATLHWVENADHTWNTKHPFDGTTDALEEAIAVSATFIKAYCT